MTSGTGQTLRFDVFGRFVVEVERRDDRWVVLHRSGGTRRPDPSLVLPAEAAPEELAGHLEDLLHEYGRPGTTVRRLA